jgi:hypothetical protein
LVCDPSASFLQQVRSQRAITLSVYAFGGKHLINAS